MQILPQTTEQGRRALTAFHQGVEVWVPIVGWENLYEISNLGRVKSLPRRIVNSNNKVQNRKERIMKLTINPHTSYSEVRLAHKESGRKPKAFKVSRLVLEAFVGPCPKGLQTCFLTQNPTDCSINNVSWGTQKDAMRKSLGQPRRTGQDISKEQLKLMVLKRSEGASILTLSQEFGTNPCYLTSLLADKSKLEKRLETTV